MCGGREVNGDGDNSLGGRFSSDRLLLRRDLRPLGAMIVSTGCISLKEKRV